MSIAFRFGSMVSVLSAVIALSPICFMRNAEATVYEPASGRTLYVSPLGTDTNSCTISAPCREIRRALSLVQAGDLISVADGGYLGFNVADKKGTALAPIVIQAGGGAYVTVSTDRGTDNKDNIYIYNSSHVILNGLATSAAPRAGIRISKSQHIIVSSSIIANNGTWGIFTDFADDVIFEDNEVSGSGTQHGIYVSNSSQRPIVRRNHLFNNKLAGVQINADATFGGPGITEGALIERNVIFGNGAGGAAGINLDGVHNSIIRNNLLYNNRGIGITAFKDDGASGPRGNLFANNTIVQPSNGRVGLQLSSSSGKNTVRNNIVIHLGTRAGIELVDNADVTFTDSNNNIVDRIGFPSGSVLVLSAVKASSAYGHLDPDSLSATPASLFIDVAASNYDLLHTAVAIDRGVNLAQVTNDFADRSRPQNSTTDIGAYEQSLIPDPQARYSSPLLILPQVQVGTEMYHAELAYRPGGAALEFQLSAARLITSAGSGLTSYLENGVLVIPFVKVGALTYRVEFALVDPTSYIFRLEKLLLR